MIVIKHHNTVGHRFLCSYECPFLSFPYLCYWVWFIYVFLNWLAEALYMWGVMIKSVNLTGCPVKHHSWCMSVRVFLEETTIWIPRWVKRTYPSQCWRASSINQSFDGLCIMKEGSLYLLSSDHLRQDITLLSSAPPELDQYLPHAGPSPHIFIFWASSLQTVNGGTSLPITMWANAL